MALPRRISRKEKCLLCAVVWVCFFVITIFIMLEHSKISCNQSTSQYAGQRISTAWTYEEPIPDSIVSNIVRLADQNPNMRVYAYCGSSQCIEALERQNRKNMKVEFAFVNEIIKGTSNSLEEWLTHHPINKALAGREFETHLQDVTMIGILWKYGGVYINPTLKFEKDISDVFPCTSTSGWVTQSTKSLSTFDACFFASNHSLIGKLASLYGSQYPTRKSDSTLFQQGYLKTVWNMVLEVTRKRPIVLNKVPASKLAVDPHRNVSHFGVVSRSQSVTDNSIQEFAQLLFLPFVDTFIEIDNPGRSHRKNVTAFLSGLGRGESWKPPSTLDPIMVSVHLQEDRDGSVEKIKYLKQQEPIGCADSATQNFLTKNSVSSYLSGSLMLLLNNKKPTECRIYLSNLEDEVIKLLPTEIQKVGIHLKGKGLKSTDIFNRLEAAYRLMRNYTSASLVITQCFHCASACASLGTPVIFINTTKSSYASGMTSLFHTLDLYNKSREQGREWLANFPWKNIPPNPDLALMMKLRATAWNVIRKRQTLYDTAKKLGIIPMSPPQILPEDGKLVFNMIFTSSEKDEVSVFRSYAKVSGGFNWRHQRSVESVFRHHPTSTLIIHSNTLSQDMFNVFTEVGYSLIVRPYDLEALLKGSPAEGFLKKLPSAKRQEFWINNEANLLRLLIMYKYGGVYLDTDMYLVRPLHSLRMNGAGWQDKNNTLLNNAFLMFEKAHPFVREVLETFVKKYDGAIWGHNGPDLLTAVWKKWKKLNTSNDEHAMEPYKYTSFYLIHYEHIRKDCFETVGGETFNTNMTLLPTEAYGLHTYAKFTGDVGISSRKIKKGTLCSYLLNEYCVFCDDTY